MAKLFRSELAKNVLGGRVAKIFGSGMAKIFGGVMAKIFKRVGWKKHFGGGVTEKIVR